MKILLTLFVLFFSSQVLSYQVLGMYECGEILVDDKNNNKNSKTLTLTWLQGYISARNYIDNADKTAEYESLYFAVIKFCKENPLKDLNDAARDIYSQL